MNTESTLMGVDLGNQPDRTVRCYLDEGGRWIEDEKASQEIARVLALGKEKIKYFTIEDTPCSNSAQ